MQIEKKTKTVEVLEDVTLTLSPKEARILMDIVGYVWGYPQGPLRTFTSSLYKDLGGVLPNAIQKTRQPFLESPQASPNYEPNV